MAREYYTLTNNNIIKGGHIMLFIDTNTIPTTSPLHGKGYQPLAFATSHSLQKTLNTTEVSTKDHGDSPATLGQSISWQITTDNLYSIQGYRTLNDVFNSMKPVKVAFGESSFDNSGQASIVAAQGATSYSYNWQPDNTGFYEEGMAVIQSLQVTAGAGDNATYSATLQGSGTIDVHGS